MPTASKIVMFKGEAPLTPPINTSIIYIKNDGKFYTKDENNLETQLGSFDDTAVRSAVIASSISDGDTTHAPDGNSVFDALAAKAPLASPTFTGTVDVSAATLTLADDQISGSKINGYMGKNAIINGNFDVWQRGTSLSSIGQGGYYLADRFGYYNTTLAIFSISQDTNVPTQEQSGLKSNYSLKTQVTTADTSITANEFLTLYHSIEGYNFAQFSGKSATLSFWVKSSKTGIYCFSLRNSGADASYVTEYTINQANTWEKKIITINFNYFSGTWNYTNGLGIRLQFALANASPYITATKDAWEPGNYFSTSNQVNVCDTIGNTFYISQVQLELGPVATDFECRPFGLEMMLCQRYFERFSGIAYTPYAMLRAHNINDAYGSLLYTQKRAAPTIAFSSYGDFLAGASSGNVTLTALAAYLIGTKSCRINASSSNGFTSGQCLEFQAGNNTTHYFDISAEL